MFESSPWRWLKSGRDSGGGRTSFGCGRSASLFGNVRANFPVGLTDPVRIFAKASAPRIPGYHASTTPATLASQGIVAGLPVSSTTMVLGFAAATVSMSLLWSAERSRVGTSMASDSH